MRNNQSINNAYILQKHVSDSSVVCFVFLNKYIGEATYNMGEASY